MGVLLSFPSGDPITDFANRDLEYERWLQSRPVCVICDHPIQEESAYLIQGNYVCEKCMKEFKVSIDD